MHRLAFILLLIGMVILQLTQSTASPTQARFSTPTPSPFPKYGNPAPTSTPNAPTLASNLPEQFVFGQSVEGRDLVGYRLGTGEQVILLVGGVHAGLEGNAVQLVGELRDYFRNHPSAIHPSITFVIIPLLNPDGLRRGGVVDGRFNGNGVDLNRNWGCRWSPQAFFRNIPVNAGVHPFSEPETIALRDLILRLQPASALFYHSAANGVFAGHCTDDGSISQPMVAVYGASAGYPHDDFFTAYPVTGTAPSWLDSIGIPSADIELLNRTDTEFERNLRGVLAVQAWLVLNASQN